MASKAKSRWDDEEEDPKEVARRKAEKEAKRKAKLEKQKVLEEQQRIRQNKNGDGGDGNDNNGGSEMQPPPSKRRRLTPVDGNAEEINGPTVSSSSKLLRFPMPKIKPCRHIDQYAMLNHIEEGSYGVVSRAKDKTTGEIVAVKKLKLEREADGFPITSLREIQTLMVSKHPNVVNLREVVVGDALNQVYIVMDFIEHDLKTLLEDMPEPFLLSEVKTLMLQLLSATALMHSHWIVHRDLKTSNLLMNNRGMIKVADFGLARSFGDPLPHMTQLVVTLWYRSPELLLGAKEYSTAVDMWSIGCIFGELLTKQPLLQGKNEIDQISKIFDLCGIPTDEEWPGFRRLPNAKSLNFPRNKQTSGHILRSKFPLLPSSGVSLLAALLTLDPERRISAEDAMKHPFFREDPKPKSAAMFPTFPSKAGQERRRRVHDSPSAPMRGQDAPVLKGDVHVSIFDREDTEVGGGFSLKVG